MHDHVLIGIEPGHEHTDKVHQVITRECQCQRQSTGQDGNLQDIHLQHAEDRHDDAPSHQQNAQQGQNMGIHPSHQRGIHQRRVFQALEDREIGNRGDGDTAPHSSYRLDLSLVTV